MKTCEVLFGAGVQAGWLISLLVERGRGTVWKDSSDDRFAVGGRGAGELGWGGGV